MIENKIAYHTNFTGIKYNNNPLEADANSFVNANNVYLNKYGALISRPPILAQDHPKEAYSSLSVTPINLKLASTYNLSNDGVLYVVLNTDTSRYTFRYKKPNNTYSDVINVSTLASYKDFMLTQYKQYYILFTIGGARVLNTDTVNGDWVALSTIVDIPVTVIQTGNEKLMLPANQLTASYKKQFILKPDSDDTIYTLPVSETATVVFPSQTDVTYAMPNANQYTRDRMLRKLNTPANNQADTLLSMVGEKIAVAHSDRVDISLDYGETFQTIVYPTNVGPGYKNTASLSDDGQCFFYVHTNGVYRYMLGTEQWDLIEVVINYSYSVFDSNWYEDIEIEREVKGVLIDNTAQGANYCHFVNAEKFTFMLAHYRPATSDWISVCYVKGTNLTNLFDQDYKSENNLLNSFATVNNTPINIIGGNLTKWLASPYRHKNVSRILDNDTIVFCTRQTDLSTICIIFKSMPTHIWLGKDIYTDSFSINYVTTRSNLLSAPSYTDHPNALLAMMTNQIKVLMKASSGSPYWQIITYTLSYVITTVGDKNTYTRTFTTVFNEPLDLFNQNIPSDIIYMLNPIKYITNSLYSPDGRLLIVDNATILADYALPFIASVEKMVISGSYYLVYNASDNSWYTNIPILTTLTYTYLNNDEFTQVPRAFFDDQNLWLAMGNTLWIGNLVDDKLSIPAINNNVFSKAINNISPLTATSKAIIFADSITLCEEAMLSTDVVVWHYYPLKFTLGVRQGDTVIITNDGKLTIFPTKYGLAALTYQLDIAATEQAITYLTDDIKSLWSDFYKASSAIKILHHNTQLILSNGTNNILIFDFRTNGWYPLTLPEDINISSIQPSIANYEILELQPKDAVITNLVGLYQLNKEHDELYTYATPYRDLTTIVIPWHITSQLLLLAAPNHYKNISQLIIDQVDSHELKQSAYLTTQLFRQRGNLVKPSIELIYDIVSFAKIIKKVNWWKVLGIRWQLENDANSSYPTQLRLYNIGIQYNISYEVK